MFGKPAQITAPPQLFLMFNRFWIYKMKNLDYKCFDDYPRKCKLGCKKYETFLEDKFTSSEAKIFFQKTRQAPFLMQVDVIFWNHNTLGSAHI